jgi:hypothetical protein
VWFLAKEFFLSEVSAECATFSVPVDQFSLLFERVSSLERQISSFSNPGRQIEEEIASQEEGLESLRLGLEKVKSSVEAELGRLRNDLEQLQTTSKPSASPSAISKAPNSPTSVPPQQPISNPSSASPVPSTSCSPTKPSPSPSCPKPSPSPVPTSSPKPSGSPTPSAAKSQNKVEIPMKEAKSLDGIISYLSQKHGGNVGEKGIVTITSKSVFAGDLKCVADLTSDSRFISKDEPGQLVCWDFGEMRVRPTHYTLRAWQLKSWVVEGSLDGRSWTEIDRRTNNQDFKMCRNTASFAVSNPAEFRFIRLTQTAKRRPGDDCLFLRAVEFFGTLSE